MPGVLSVVPNPVFGEATLPLELRLGEAVLLEVYDPNGRRIRPLWNGRLKAGEHRLCWDGRGDTGLRVTSGVYFIRFISSIHSDSRRLVLLC